jgi:hypothetical protein
MDDNMPQTIDDKSSDQTNNNISCKLHAVTL